ncbi:MAG: DUF3426 domain-containing protein [Pseudomonadota bacterium]
MIVTCEKCQSKFELDDNSVKDEGSKVRCSKCEHVFTVFRSSGEIVSDEFPDIGLTLDDLEPQQEVNSPQSDAADIQKDESTLEIPEIADALDFGIEAPVDDEAKVEAPEAGGGDSAEYAAIEDALENLELEMAIENKDQPSETARPALGSIEGVEEIFTSEVVLNHITPGVESVESIEGEKLEPVLDEITVEAVISADEAPVDSPPPTTVKSEEWIVNPDGAFFRTEKRSNIISIFLLILIAAGSIGAGIYLITYYDILGMMDKVELPKAKIITVELPKHDPGNLKIGLLDVRGYFKESNKAGKLYIIEGFVRNDYSERRSHVGVRGILYDSSGNVLKRKSVYCGNIFTPDELATLSIDDINFRLSKESGMNDVNIDISQGGKVPFMIVFQGLSGDLSEYTVEVEDSILSKKE